MSTELRERLRTMAEADDRSMNSLICRILEQVTNSAPAEPKLTTDQVRAIREAIETLARRWSETEDVASPFEEVMLVLPKGCTDRQLLFLDSYSVDGFQLVISCDDAPPASNVEVLRFSGQIDPLSIQPGNVVPSGAIANVRVEQRGRGAQDAAQGIGWLGRFFLSLSPL